VDAAVDLALEEARGFEHAQMLGYGGKGNIERLSQLADRGFPVREACEDGAARGIGECAEGGIERRAGIVNHTV
jgi:hypothetical protein